MSNSQMFVRTVCEATANRPLRRSIPGIVVAPGRDETPDFLQVFLAQTPPGRQMRDQSIGVTTEEEIGETGEHRAPNLLLGGARSIDELSTAATMGHQSATLQTRQHGRHRGGGQPVTLLGEPRLHVLGGGFSAIPQHPHERELLVAELGWRGHDGPTHRTTDVELLS